MIIVLYSCDFQDKGFDERAGAGKALPRVSVCTVFLRTIIEKESVCTVFLRTIIERERLYRIVFHAVEKNRGRASHKSVPYFWVPREESPAKSRWPSDDKEVVDEGKSSEVTLAVGRRGGCRRR